MKAVVSLQVPAGKATPAPPLGPILGQNGVNIQEFCTQFNDMTKDKMGDVLPVKLTVMGDNSFKIKVKEPTVASMIKKAINLQKGSANAKKEKVGKISRRQLQEIATRKLPDLNTKDTEAATNIVEGTARSLGLEIT
ncbi:50S ribosomal protein L11 [Candidatus Dojkabacteria bacterium]|uniref:Large ribosomal subunit protein uL11 n=1 Tax=Candidatus Dojkabacteria bacterium TaxID=2099670 RepID=A0A955I6P5_9BACT|nr:50S ribosomal protein L11 [Candidatus Dojkabacteria bacterium]